MSDLKPFVYKRWLVKAPTASPLSGFGAKGVGWYASLHMYDCRWRSVKTPLGKRAKKPGFYPGGVDGVSVVGSGKTAGFEIMELAGSCEYG